MKKYKKKYMVVTSLIIVVLICFLIAPTIQASTLGDAMDDGDNFIDNGSKGSSIFDMSSIYNVVNFVYTILMILGTIYFVIKGIIIGWHIIWGSVSEKADGKQMIAPYLVILVVFAFSASIFKVVLNLALTIDNM